MRFVAFLACVALAAGTPAGAQSASAGASVKAGVERWRANDWAGAVAAWQPYAAAGDADALFNMGQAYKLGRGVPKDPAVARDYYRRAAVKGHLAAQANLGILLFQAGEKPESMRWLKAAADKGEMRAQYVFGIASWNGDGTPRNLGLAYGYMLRAAAQGLSQATNALGNLEGGLSAVDRANGEAISASLAAGQGVPSALAARPGVVAARDESSRPPVSVAGTLPAPAAAPPSGSIRTVAPQSQATPAIAPPPRADAGRSAAVTPAVPATRVQPAPLIPPAAKPGPAAPATADTKPATTTTSTPVPAAAPAPAPAPVPKAAAPALANASPPKPASVETRPAANPAPAAAAKAVPATPAASPAAKPPAVETRPPTVAPVTVRTVTPQTAGPAQVRAATPQTSTTTVAPAATVVAATPGAAPSLLDRGGRANGPPLTTVTEHAAAKPRAQVAKPKPSGWRVQLGAYAKPAQAEAAWASFYKAHKDAAGKTRPLYDSDGGVTKLQLGPFPDKAAAKDACARMAFAGQSCFVTGG